MKDHECYHAVTVVKLRQLLSELPDHWVLVPNEVRNLAILDGAGDYMGYVDLFNDKVELTS